MTRQLWTVGCLDLVAASRLKWIRLLTLAFGLMAAAAAYSAGAAAEFSGAAGFERTTMTLVPVVLLLVPLAALVLGVSGQAADAGSEPFLFGQPIGRATVVIGRWAGQSAALAGAVAVGLGAGGAWIGMEAGPNGALGFAFFVAASALLGVIFLAIAAAIASSTDRRLAALGVATFAWFFFVLLYDATALSLAQWIAGAAGGRVLFASVFGNPADLVRVIALNVSGTPNVLGAAGDAWVRFLGGTGLAALAAGTALATWTFGPLGIAAYLVRRRDL